MILDFLNGSPDQQQWCQDTVDASLLDWDVYPIRVEIEFLDDPTPPGYPEPVLAYTTTFGWFSTVKMLSDLGDSNRDKSLFMDVFHHEIGHAFLATLSGDRFPEIAELFVHKDGRQGSMDFWDASEFERDRILEATVETFKDVFLGPLRKRSVYGDGGRVSWVNWRLPFYNFERWLDIYTPGLGGRFETFFHPDDSGGWDDSGDHTHTYISGTLIGGTFHPPGVFAEGTSVIEAPRPLRVKAIEAAWSFTERGEGRPPSGGEVTVTLSHEFSGGWVPYVVWTWPAAGMLDAGKLIIPLGDDPPPDSDFWNHGSDQFWRLSANLTFDDDREAVDIPDYIAWRFAVSGEGTPPPWPYNESFLVSGPAIPGTRPRRQQTGGVAQPVVLLSRS